jgi:hypothetical protein
MAIISGAGSSPSIAVARSFPDDVAASSQDSSGKVEHAEQV